MTRRGVGVWERMWLSLPEVMDRQAVMPSAAQIVAHLRTPLFRNAYALILNTGLTSALGFVYWLVAARLYPTEVVGLNSAALAAMMFLAGVAQLNLANVLIRFIPQVGQAASRLVGLAMLATVGVGLVAGLTFVWGTDYWAPSLSFLQDSPILAASFALATVTWGVFSLQEGALTGLRRATWVPVRNTIFALGKVALLFACVAVFPAYGIVASWAIMAALTLGPTAWIVRRQLARGLSGGDPPQNTGGSRSQIFKYAAADYAGSLAWLAATMLVPVLVTELAGPTATAHFYVAWAIAYSLYLVAPGMGSSLIVESVLDPNSLGAYSRRAFLQTVRLVVPLVVMLVLAAPYVLSLLGGSYAAEGTTLVRLLALSAIPNIVNTLFISIARAQRHMFAIVAILAAQCISVLLLSYTLLNIMGITGVGLAWLISQSAVAVALLILRRRIFRPAGETAR
ncbi:MAG: lipopolysaccharide biosynthesis protein [Chloroflexota bacterium]